LPKHLSALALKGAAGFLVALAFWFWLAPPYARALAALSEAAVRTSEWPAVTSIEARGTLLVVDRSDFPSTPDTLQLAVESTDITFNFILLVTLFAAGRRVFSDRNVFGFLGASLLLVLVHVAAVVSFVKADYATSFGRWSAAHYGAVARTFWTAAPYFYSVAGVYGSAFALWWLLRDPATGHQDAPKAKKRSR
jgi:hypothetical protein